MISKPGIDHGAAFDWGRVSENYAKFRDVYPPAFYDKIMELGLCVKGQQVLDLGTGTGVLPRNLYPYGAQFTGADISENQIAHAKRLSAEANMDIEYVVASAEDANFPDQSFDVVTACQCFHYFDKAAALPNIHRMLKPGGHFCILFMTPLPSDSEIVRRGEELVLQYNPAWTGGGVGRYTPPETPAWAKPLYEAANIVTFDLNVPFTRENWHGCMMTCRGISASFVSEETTAAFEQAHLAYLNTLPDSFEIPHFVTMLNLRKQ